MTEIALMYEPDKSFCQCEPDHFSIPLYDALLISDLSYLYDLQFDHIVDQFFYVDNFTLQNVRIPYGFISNND